MRKLFLFIFLGIMLLGIVLLNQYHYMKAKAKCDKYTLEGVTELARLVRVPGTFIDLSLGRTELFSKDEELQISTYLIRPRSIHPRPDSLYVFRNIDAEEVNSHDDAIAIMEVKECRSLSIAKLNLLADLSMTSMPLVLRAEQMNRVNGIGNYCLKEKLSPDLYFVRGGTVVKLKALPATTDLQEIAKAVDRALLWAIWRKRLLWLCMVVSLLTVLDLGFRKRSSNAGGNDGEGAVSLHNSSGTTKKP